MLSSSNPSESPLIGKDIAWGSIQDYALLVKHFTPLAEIKNGKIVNDVNSMPYALLEVECLELKSPSKDLQLPVMHKMDFTHLWEVYQGRGVADNEEVIIGYAKPENAWLRALGWTIPHLRITVSPKGNMKNVLNDEGLPVILADWDPIKGRVA